MENKLQQNIVISIEQLACNKEDQNACELLDFCQLLPQMKLKRSNLYSLICCAKRYNCPKLFQMLKLLLKEKYNISFLESIFDEIIHMPERQQVLRAHREAP